MNLTLRKYTHGTETVNREILKGWALEIMKELRLLHADLSIEMLFDQTVHGSMNTKYSNRPLATLIAGIGGHEQYSACIQETGESIDAWINKVVPDLASNGEFEDDTAYLEQMFALRDTVQRLPVERERRLRSRLSRAGLPVYVLARPVTGGRCEPYDDPELIAELAADGYKIYRCRPEL